MSGLKKYDIRNSVPFNFNYTTESQKIRATADKLLNVINAKTGKKDDVYLELMVKFLLNIYMGYMNAKMTRINLRPKYYSNIPKRYRHETESYAAVKKIVNSLESHGYLNVSKGFKIFSNKTGRLTALEPTNKLINEIKTIQRKDFIVEPPKETIILRDDKKGPKDYIDSADTKKWRAELKKYNDFIKKQDLTLSGLTKSDIEENSEYFRNYDLVDTTNLQNLSSSSFSNIQLHYFYMCRVFNKDFKHGGRFYGGAETLPSAIRRFIKINGSSTVELDFASYQIRMLYHKSKVDYTQDAYSALVTPGSIYTREIYKLVALIILNAEDREAAIKGLRKKFIALGLLPSAETTNVKIEALIDNLITHHTRIIKYFFKGKGLKLQFIDSQITNEILQHFTSKKIPVLSVHDSFIIESNYKDDLKKIMIKKYKDKFKYKPQIT